MIEASGDLVLVHGWASHPGVFAPVEGALASRYRLVRAAMPGYGDGEQDIPGDVDVLAERLRAATPAGATWIAWSTGALPALALAAGPSPHVGRLNLVAPVIRFERAADWPQGAKPGVLHAFGTALDGRPGVLVRRFARMVFYPDVGRDRADAFVRDFDAADIDPRALAAGLDLLAGADLRERLAAITVPVTLFHGERDAVVAVSSSDHAAAAVPGARLCKLAGAGHAPFITHADEFLELFDIHGRH